MSTPSRAPLLARVCFAAACTVLVLTSVMHLIATLAPEPDPPDDEGRQLVRLLQTYKLELPGTQRTTAELMEGFNYHFSLSLIGIGLVGAAAVWGRPGAMRPVAVAAAVLLAGMTANSIACFFIIPTVCLGLGAVLFAVAGVSAHPPITPA